MGFTDWLDNKKPDSQVDSGVKTIYACKKPTSVNRMLMNCSGRECAWTHKRNMFTTWTVRE